MRTYRSYKCDLFLLDTSIQHQQITFIAVIGSHLLAIAAIYPESLLVRHQKQSYPYVPKLSL